MTMRLLALLLCAGLFIGATPRHERHLRHAPPPLTAQAIEQAQFAPGQKAGPALIVKAEVLLDRAGFSPGVIDGHDGDNLRKALAAFQRQNGRYGTGILDAETFNVLAATSEDPIMGDYVISDADVKGPFTQKIPARQSCRGLITQTRATNSPSAFTCRNRFSRRSIPALTSRAPAPALPSLTCRNSRDT
jgi:Putative peptidoglycan binding domain